MFKFFREPKKTVNRRDYDPFWCDGHECHGDCDRCQWREEVRDHTEYDLEEVLAEVRLW